MWKNIGYEQCLSFISCQLRPGGVSSHLRSPIRPSITISRMTGSGGRTIASLLADYLQDRAPVDCRWTVFDRNLIARVLEEHHLPKRVADFMPENHKPMLGDMLEELLGLHPSSWTLVRETAETIFRLAQMGYVILVGRGANVITNKLETVFHVRLVGSVEKRIERMQTTYDLERRHAQELMHEQDKGRRRYLKEHFSKDIDDPLLYHLVINTDRIPYEDTARLIGDGVIHRFHLARRAETAVA
jgi:cytidylate kinase